MEQRPHARRNLLHKSDPPLLSVGSTESHQCYYRAIRTTGFFDPAVMRTISLTFAEADWQTRLTANYNTGSNLIGNLLIDGTNYSGVGARYRGNTSYTMGGLKKSVNIEIDATNSAARLMGYETINLNNAAGDSALMREPIYFNAAIAGFPAGSKIRYYVEARAGNSAKAATFAPARAEQETYSFRVGLVTAGSTDVVINEIMAANVKTLADPQGDFDDWIELRNLTDQPVALTGRYVTDDPATPPKWPFPVGTTIPARGFLLIWADEDGAATSGLHANFKLSASGEQVLLIDTDQNQNAVLDLVTFEAQEEDVSYGRLAADAEEFGPMQPTPGAANNREHIKSPPIPFVGFPIKGATAVFGKSTGRCWPPLPCPPLRRVGEGEDSWRGARSSDLFRHHPRRAIARPLEKLVRLSLSRE